MRLVQYNANKYDKKTYIVDLATEIFNFRKEFCLAFRRCVKVKTSVMGCHDVKVRRKSEYIAEGPSLEEVKSNIGVELE